MRCGGGSVFGQSVRPAPGLPWPDQTKSVLLAIGGDDDSDGDDDVGNGRDKGLQHMTTFENKGLNKVVTSLSL